LGEADEAEQQSYDGMALMGSCGLSDQGQESRSVVKRIMIEWGIAYALWAG
jgi:hypothetical protein